MTGKSCISSIAKCSFFLRESYEFWKFELNKNSKSS